jgi:hypothetical protein
MFPHTPHCELLVLFERQPAVEPAVEAAVEVAMEASLEPVVEQPASEATTN